MNLPAQILLKRKRWKAKKKLKRIIVVLLPPAILTKRKSPCYMYINENAKNAQLKGEENK